MSIKHPPCAAVTTKKSHYATSWFARCQAQGVAKVDGVWLCGTHVNVVHDRPQLVLVELEKKDD